MSASIIYLPDHSYKPFTPYLLQNITLLPLPPVPHLSPHQPLRRHKPTFAAFLLEPSIHSLPITSPISYWSFPLSLSLRCHNAASAFYSFNHQYFTFSNTLTPSPSAGPPLSHYICRDATLDVPTSPSFPSATSSLSP